VIELSPVATAWFRLWRLRCPEQTALMPPDAFRADGKRFVRRLVFQLSMMACVTLLRACTTPLTKMRLNCRP